MTITTLVRKAVFGVSVALSPLALAQGGPPPAQAAPGGGQMAKVREACRPDVERLCKDVKPGGGRIRDCLKTHQSELSDPCKAAINDAREHRGRGEQPR
jgi:hypothetical protein